MSESTVKSIRFCKIEQTKLVTLHIFGMHNANTNPLWLFLTSSLVFDKSHACAVGSSVGPNEVANVSEWNGFEWETDDIERASEKEEKHQKNGLILNQCDTHCLIPFMRKKWVGFEQKKPVQCNRRHVC